MQWYSLFDGQQMTVSKQISFDNIPSGNVLLPVAVKPFKTTTVSAYIVAFINQDSSNYSVH